MLHDGLLRWVVFFRARTENTQYHPVTGQPVFLRMVIEDKDGRALKFRTRTRAEYARVRPGMVAEAILVRAEKPAERGAWIEFVFYLGFGGFWLGGRRGMAKYVW